MTHFTGHGIYTDTVRLISLLQGCTYSELRKQAAEHAAGLDAQGMPSGETFRG